MRGNRRTLATDGRRDLAMRVGVVELIALLTTRVPLALRPISRMSRRSAAAGLG
jgi:hypothetical protein